MTASDIRSHPELSHGNPGNPGNPEIPDIQSRKGLNGQSKEIKQNWKGPRTFDICFSVIFGCYRQSLISGREAGH